MLKVDLEYESKILFIRLNGNLDKRKTYKINNYIVPLLQKHKIKKVIVNLKNLKSIDSCGLTSVLRVRKTIHNNKGLFYICEASDVIKKELVKLRLSNLSSENVARRRLEVN